jgi:hypothetical protein
MAGVEMVVAIAARRWRARFDDFDAFDRRRSQPGQDIFFGVRRERRRC